MSGTDRPRALYIGALDKLELAYPPALRAELARRLDVVGAPATHQQVERDPARLNGIDVVMATWGMVKLEGAVLAAADRLKLVCYAAGSVKPFFTAEAAARGVRVAHAAAQNAVPVAEFAAAAAVLSLKRTWMMMRASRSGRHFVKPAVVPGVFRRRVGLVSLGLTGRLTAERLAAYDLELVAYDPYPDTATAERLGVTMTSLEELFATCDVVSLHAPWIPATEGMIHRGLLETLRADATLINTARGAVINEDHLVEVLRQRPDLTAVLDVTWPEPPPPDSPLWDLDNVFLTPHIAGSMSGEVARMGEAMRDELDRFLNGQPLRQEVRAEMLATMA